MKRPTIKGKGREIFFPEPQSKPHHNASTPADHNAIPTPRQHYGKSTFWLPGELIQKLDRYWLKHRAKDRKITKSGIVANALDRFLEEKGRVS